MERRFVVKQGEGLILEGVQFRTILKLVMYNFVEV